MGADNQIDYIEFQAADLVATRSFFEQLFGWKFTDTKLKTEMLTR